MEIKIVSGKEPVVRLTAAEKRALWTTLEVVEGIRDHIEEMSDDRTASSYGTAGGIFEAGFCEFVEQYAPETTKGGGDVAGSETMGGAGEAAEGVGGGVEAGQG